MMVPCHLCDGKMQEETLSDMSNSSTLLIGSTFVALSSLPCLQLDGVEMMLRLRKVNHKDKKTINQTAYGLESRGQLAPSQQPRSGDFPAFLAQVRLSTHSATSE